ncbi:MAG: haloacid dehalogenase-like hydrolase [Actinobacteria bacterium]|nr:haloacid dehalogenase-like hydrolase [Actinomycetota bacterium]
MKRLVLWDVDGTLVRLGRASRHPFQAALTNVLGRDLEAEFHARVEMSGKTDPQIARELLLLAEVAEHQVDEDTAAVLEHLESELAALAHRIPEDGRVLPGIGELLERLHAEPLVVQSVLTGNLAANAAVKLGAFGLDRWLDLSIGAYGSDDADRTHLVPVARRRAAEGHGMEFPPESVWVVGDTPADLACARAGGAHCLLVATGRFPVRELTGLGADAVLEDLSDTELVVEILSS